VRLSSIPSQVAALALRSPDILALQEVSRGMVEPLRRELSEVGLGYAVDSFTVAPSWEEKGPRRCGLMIATRFPVARRPPRSPCAGQGGCCRSS
jgi:hypothetical protein